VVTVGPTLTRDLPYPGEVQRVRVRGRDTQGCVTHWSMQKELSWEGCYPGAPEVVAVDPAPLGTDVTVMAVLTMTFSEVVYAPIAQECLGEVRLQAGASFVQGTWAYADRYDSNWVWGVRFTPTVDLAEKTWHYGVVTGMKDGHGYRMAAPYSWPFMGKSQGAAISGPAGNGACRRGAMAARTAFAREQSSRHETARGASPWNASAVVKRPRSLNLPQVVYRTLLSAQGFAF